MTREACQSEYSAAGPKSVDVRRGPQRYSGFVFERFSRYLPQWLAQAALLSLAAILLLLPVKTTTRSLSPAGMETLKLSALSLSAPLLSGNPAAFKIAVGQDVGVNGSLLTLEDVTKIEPAAYWAKYSEILKEYPLLFNHTVAFSIANYDRINHCLLTLNLGDHHVSQPLNCRRLKDNGLAVFKFDSPVPPGVYQATLISTGDPNNAVAIYWAKDAQGQSWVSAFSWQGDISPLMALSIWGRSHSLQFAFYTLSLCLLIVGLGLGRNVSTALPWLCLLVSLYLGIFVIAAPLSGHDETAHVDMFKRSLLETDPTPAGNTDKSLQEHYLTMREHMLHEHFFRLHNARPQSVGACSHSILSGCGESERPLKLYHQYGSLLHKLGIVVNSPAEIQWAGRALNYLWLISFLIGIFCLFPRHYALAMVITLAFTGCLLGQIASVTNDVPMYVTGLWGALAFAYFFHHASDWRAWAGVGVFFGLLFYVRQVDQSWLAGLPTVLLFPLGLLSLILPKAGPPTGQGPFDPEKRFAIVPALYFAAGVMGFFVFVRGLMMTPQGTQFVDHLIALGSTISGEFARLRGLTALPLSHALQIVYSYLCSIYGSYVWGHSYYDNFVYVTLLAGTSYLSYLGARKIADQSSHLKMAFILLCLGMACASQFLGIVAIASQDFGPDLVRWQSFTKVRLIAPGLACILPVPLLGLVHLLESPHLARRLFLIVYIWGSLLLCYYWPQFFIIDTL
jgi:hypothetical protein